MANAVLSNAKKPALLEEERAYLNTLELRLFVNNFTPDADSTALPASGLTLGDFTETADGGYAELAGVGFTSATLNGLDQAEVIAPPVTWTFDHDAGDFWVYGFFYTDPSDGEVVMSQRDDAPLHVTAAGTTYTVVPRKVMDAMA